MEQNRINELINLSKQNDTKAFSLLVETYQPLVFRLAFRLLCCEDEAKDAVQETFIKVWLNLTKYSERSKFSTWLYKIAVNTCYDRLRVLQRSLQRKATEAEIAKLSVPSEESVESGIINEELKELIIQLTNTMTPKQKTVFILREIEELETAEVEEITGLSAKKIKSNLYLARKIIREKLNTLHYGTGQY